jgi:hypothetical protein
MFNWLTKRKPKPRQIEDPVFGQMTWVPSLSYWEAKVRFGPTNGDIFLKISAQDECGPGKAQHAVFQQIVERYEEVVGSVAPLLRREHHSTRAVDDGLPQDVPFLLEELSIPETESDSMKWEMRFYCDDGGDCNYVVYMRGWQPTGELFGWD